MAGGLERPRQIPSLLVADFRTGWSVTETRIYHYIEFFNVKICDHNTYTKISEFGNAENKKELTPA